MQEKGRVACRYGSEPDVSVDLRSKIVKQDSNSNSISTQSRLRSRQGTTHPTKHGTGKTDPTPHHALP
jgi:hypothetical protein